MPKIRIAVRVLCLGIALVGLWLPCRACRRRGADEGLVAEWHVDEGSGSVLEGLK